MQSLCVKEWVKRAGKSSLTVDDLQCFAPGESVDFVTFYDVSQNLKRSSPSLRPQELLMKRQVYRFSPDDQGGCMHGDFTSLPENLDGEDTFKYTFCIEIRGVWRSVTEHGFVHTGYYTMDIDKHFSKFPRNSRIGFRQPVIRLADFLAMPRVRIT